MQTTAITSLFIVSVFVLSKMTFQVLSDTLLNIPLSWNCSTLMYNSREINIECCIHRQLQWNLAEFQNWSREVKNVSVSLVLRCYENGSISLRNPINAKNLASLEIDNCNIYHFFDVESSDSTTNKENELKTLILGNITLYQSYSEIIKNKKKKIGLCQPNVELRFYVLNLKGYFEIPDVPYTHVQYKRVNPYCVYKDLKYVEFSHNAQITADLLVMDFLNNPNNEFPVLQTLALNNNQMRRVPQVFNEYKWWTKFKNLSKVDFSNNHIQHITFPSWNLTDNTSEIFINMCNNNITIIDEEMLDAITNKGRLISLSDNPFYCGCNMTIFKNFVMSLMPLSPLWMLYKNLSCWEPSELKGQHIIDISQESFCTRDRELYRTRQSNDVVRNIALISVIAAVTTIMIGLCVFFQREIRFIAYSRLPRLSQRSTSDDNYKNYDVFISYSSLDEEWVHKQLYTHLQSRNFKVCLHHKDFVPGAWISENIINSIESSRHTIMVLSPNFLKSEWCLLEFRKAFHQTLVDKNGHLIVVLLKSIEIDYLEKDMKHFLRTHTYLKADEILFWEKVYQALSVKTKHEPSLLINKNNVLP